MHGPVGPEVGAPAEGPGGRRRRPLPASMGGGVAAQSTTYLGSPAVEPYSPVWPPPAWDSLDGNAPGWNCEISVGRGVGMGTAQPLSTATKRATLSARERKMSTT